MMDKIVWVSFGPDVSEDALDYAIYISKVFSSKLYSLYIKPTTYHEEKEYCLSEDEKKKNTEWNDYTYKQNLKKIEEMQNRIKKENIDSSFTVKEGVPCLEILDFANKKSADLIVIYKGKKFHDTCIVQKTTLYIIKHSSIPVLSINGSESVKDINTILVPTDKYNVGSKAFRLANNFSKKLKSRIIQLNILKKNDPKIPVEAAERMHGDTYFKLCETETQNKKTESVVIDSENIGDGIIDYIYSNDIDLVILQTYYGEKQEIFRSNGSVAEKIIHKVERPVITVNSKEEVGISEE